MEAIKGRRSIRVYKEQDLPEETVERLIDAASWAPSAGNLQPWEFVIVRKLSVKKELAGAAGQTFIERAPVVIVACANESRSSTGYGLRGKELYCIQDTAAAIQNILLTAHSLGLGTCWLGAFDEDEARKIIHAPEETRPLAIIPVGYPDEAPQQRRRRPIPHMVHHESF